MCACVWRMYMCSYTSTRSGLLTCQFMSQTGKVLLGLITMMCVCACVRACVCGVARPHHYDVCVRVCGVARTHRYDVCVCVFPGLCWNPQSTFPSSCSILEQVVTWIESWIWCKLQLDVCDIVRFLLDAFAPTQALCTFFFFFFYFFFFCPTVPTKGIVCQLKKNERKKAIAVTVVFHCYSAFAMFASSSGHSGLHLKSTRD